MTSHRFIDFEHRRAFRWATACAALVGIGLLSACQTQQQMIAQHEDKLAAAGFIVHPANTPERHAMLANFLRTASCSA